MSYKGFVDLQVNGYMGVDFTSPGLQIDEVHSITRALLRAGTIGYCATIITSDMEIYRRNLPLLARAMQEPGIRGCLLGIHLEGPYLSGEEGARGAHMPYKMRNPDGAEFDRFMEWSQGRISILTLAPELNGAFDLISHIRKKYSTRVALGHHLASREIIARAVDAGATLVTHLGNGCPSHLPRHESVILHQLANDSLMAGLITDGHHLPPDFIKIALRCKGPERVFVVSDMTPIAGFEPGIYENLGHRVRLTGTGRIEKVGTPYFVGSGCTLSQCMRHLRSLGLLSDDELWLVGLKNPLRILGLQPGDIESGDLPSYEW